MQFFSLGDQHVGFQEVSVHSMFQVPEVQLLNSSFVFNCKFGISTSYGKLVRGGEADNV